MSHICPQCQTSSSTSGTIPDFVIAASTGFTVHVSPGDRVHKALFLQCLLKDMCYRTLSLTLPPRRHPSTTGHIIINNQVSDPVFHPIIISVHLCTCCLCCDIVVQGIVGKYILQVACIAGDGAFKK